jgi:peptidoglycan/xylan/chitin deacetylase (PgdA/CDA1 family)
LLRRLPLALLFATALLLPGVAQAGAGQAGAAQAGGDCPASGLGDGRRIEIDPQRTPAIGAIDSQADRESSDNVFQPLDLRDREVVLTFDDGPDPRGTPQVLQALARHCVKATFFLLGRNAKRHAGLVRRIAAAGHSLGSHTWSHAMLTTLPPAAAQQEIASGIASIRRALREAPEGPGEIAFFRFPNLAYTAGLLAWLRAENTAAFSADIATRDWANPPGRETLDEVLRKLDQRGKGIILLHDNQPNTAALLPDLLEALAAGGYRVAHLVPKPKEN